MDIIKPKKGEIYKVLPNFGLYSFNLIYILEEFDDFVTYKYISEYEVLKWDFKKCPDILANKLSSLEIALCIGF